MTAAQRLQRQPAAFAPTSNLLLPSLQTAAAIAAAAAGRPFALNEETNYSRL